MQRIKEKEEGAVDILEQVTRLTLSEGMLRELIVDDGEGVARNPEAVRNLTQSRLPEWHRYLTNGDSSEKPVCDALTR